MMHRLITVFLSAFLLLSGAAPAWAAVIVGQEGGSGSGNSGRLKLDFSYGAYYAPGQGGGPGEWRHGLSLDGLLILGQTAGLGAAADIRAGVLNAANIQFTTSLGPAWLTLGAGYNAELNQNGERWQDDCFLYGGISTQPGEDGNGLTFSWSITGYARDAASSTKVGWTHSFGEGIKIFTGFSSFYTFYPEEEQMPFNIAYVKACGEISLAGTLGPLGISTNASVFAGFMGIDWETGLELSYALTEGLGIGLSAGAGADHGENPSYNCSLTASLAL